MTFSASKSVISMGKHQYVFNGFGFFFLVFFLYSLFDFYLYYGILYSVFYRHKPVPSINKLIFQSFHFQSFHFFLFTCKGRVCIGAFIYILYI